jgi:group II intron reverse transcriptase/maturase
MRLEAGELEAAWDAIRKGGKAAGPDGMRLPQFACHADRELARLERDLRTGRYAPGLYRTVGVPKEDGGRRWLCVSNLRDRVAQRVLLARITPAIESASLPCSFAYRPGLSHYHALAAVREARDRGFVHLLRADVQECFDRISHELLAELLAELPLDRDIRRLVLECIGAGQVGRPALEIGLPQGAVLSPALCNLVLTHLDRALSVRHLRPIRYADDFVVLALSARACESAQERAAYALWQLGLNLNERKTQITGFRQGFRFLGARFSGSFMTFEKKGRYCLVYPRPYPRRRGDGLGYLL